MLVIKNFLWHYVFSMNLRKYFFTFILFFPLTFYVFSQESLKSAEEEYYDFLSLQGITSRPYLNYRTLSDSDWNIKEEIVQTENADGSSTEKTSAMRHLWQNNYLGRRHSHGKSTVPNGTTALTPQPHTDKTTAHSGRGAAIIPPLPPERVLKPTDWN